MEPGLLSLRQLPRPGLIGFKLGPDQIAGAILIRQFFFYILKAYFFVGVDKGLLNSAARHLCQLNALLYPIP